MISHKRVHGMVLQGKSFSSHVTPTAPQHNQTFKQIQISICLGRFIIKPNPGSEDVLAKRIERLLIYVGKIWRIYMWKWILRVLDQGRKNKIIDQIEFINRDVFIRNAGFNVLVQTAGSCLNYLLNYLLSCAQQQSILN